MFRHSNWSAAWMTAVYTARPFLFLPALYFALLFQLTYFLLSAIRNPCWVMTLTDGRRTGGGEKEGRRRLGRCMFDIRTYCCIANVPRPRPPSRPRLLLSFFSVFRRSFKSRSWERRRQESYIFLGSYSYSSFKMAQRV